MDAIKQLRPHNGDRSLRCVYRVRPTVYERKRSLELAKSASFLELRSIGLLVDRNGSNSSPTPPQFIYDVTA